MRRTLTKFISGLFIAVLFGSILTAVAPATTAQAANGGNFDAGNIIDDALFFNSGILNEGGIQNFLQSKATNPGAANTLVNYRASSASRNADQYCGAYTGGTNELASTIIYKVAVACNINAQVLLVTLQKEQGLVTASNPSDLIYRKAMGFGCPDTASCDAKYYGFANQVYAAARQFNVYVQNPNSFNYKPYQTNTIQWNPNAACGSSQVYIQNKATAALYIYTPYRPNAAALSNINGTGDSCSAYGNRNFWRYFTDWFGSTTVSAGASAFVQAMYADVLNRTATASEINSWGRFIMNGAPPVQVAGGFVNSDEYRLIRINAAYQTILGRPAEPGGDRGWLDAMQKGFLGTDDVDKVFLASDEYLLNTGGTNETFVAALYDRLIGRPASAEEIPGWAAIAASSGRQQVVNAIWNSVETARSRVTTMYQAYLGRAPEPGGLDGWATISILEGDAKVRWAIIGSGEYWQRAIARFPNPVS
jgi:hypothetical protein